MKRHVFTLVLVTLVFVGLTGCASSGNHKYTAPDGYTARKLTDPEKELLTKKGELPVALLENLEVISERTDKDEVEYVAHTSQDVGVGDPVTIEKAADVPEATEKVVQSITTIAPEAEEASRRELANNVSIEEPKKVPRTNPIEKEARLPLCIDTANPTDGRDPVLTDSAVPTKKVEAVEALKDPQIAALWFAANPHLKLEAKQKMQANPSLTEAEALAEWADEHLVGPVALPADINVHMWGKSTHGWCSMQKGDSVWGTMAYNEQGGYFLKVYARQGCFNPVYGNIYVDLLKGKLKVLPVTVRYTELTIREITEQKVIFVRERSRWSFDVVVMGYQLNTDDAGDNVYGEMHVSLRDLPLNPKADVTLVSPFIDNETTGTIQMVGGDTVNALSWTFVLPPASQGAGTNQVTFKGDLRNLVSAKGGRFDLHFSRVLTYSYEDAVNNDMQHLSAGEESIDGSQSFGGEIRARYRLDLAGNHEIFGGIGGTFGDSSSIYVPVGYQGNIKRFHVQIGGVFDSEFDAGAHVGVQIDVFRKKVFEGEPPPTGLKRVGINVQVQKFFDDYNTTRIGVGVVFSW